MIAATTTHAVPSFSQDRRVHTWLAVKGVSDAGDAAWTIALAWTAVHLASPAVAGIVVAAGTVPRALVLLVGGVVADRFETLSIVRLVTMVRIAVLAMTVVVTVLSAASVPLLFVVAIAFGACDAVFEPSVTTLGRQLVRESDLGAYAGAGQTASRLGTMSGAAAGGALVAFGGLTASAIANLATYVVVLIFVTAVLAVRFPLPRAKAQPMLRNITEGFVHLRDEPRARTLVLTLSGLNLAVGPALGLGLALRVQQEDWGANALGLLQGLVGLGAVCGAIVLVRWRPRHDAYVGFALLLAQGLAIGALATPGKVATGTFCLVIGVTAGAASALLSAVFVRTVAPEFLGRLASMQRLGDDVLMPAAMVLFGALAGGASLQTAFLLFGTSMALLMIVTLTRTSIGPPASP